MLSEESKDDPVRLDAERVWIVDPLDGTREFAEFGRTDWAVHVALVSGGTPIAAAVALPALGEVLSTVSPPRLPPAHSGAPRLVVSRTRPPKITDHLADVLAAELVPMGSAGAKAMAVVRGEVDVYAHGGGQYEWDSAAPVGVAAAAGTARLAARRVAARLQPARSVPARPAHLPTRARGRGARGDRVGAARVDITGRAGKPDHYTATFPRGVAQLG